MSHGWAIPLETATRPRDGPGGGTYSSIQAQVCLPVGEPSICAAFCTTAPDHPLTGKPLRSNHLRTPAHLLILDIGQVQAGAAPSARIVLNSFGVPHWRRAPIHDLPRNSLKPAFLLE